MEDDSQIIFEFASGVPAVAQVNELTRYARFEIELQGADGLIRLSDAEQRLWTSVRLSHTAASRIPLLEWWKLEPVAFPIGPPASDAVDRSAGPQPASPIQAAITELVACLASGGEPSSCGEDGVASLEMCMAAYASQALGNARMSLPLLDRGSHLGRLRTSGRL